MAEPSTSSAPARPPDWMKPLLAPIEVLGDLSIFFAQSVAAIFRRPGGVLAEGRPADVTVIDPEASWTMDPAALQSRSRNTPFAGRPLRGRAALTIVGGKVAFAEERFRD